jgi:hypothetical protein
MNCAFSRQFPCKHCRVRGIPERCIPPPALHSPGQSQGHTIASSSTTPTASTRLERLERERPYTPLRTSSSSLTDIKTSWSAKTDGYSNTTSADRSILLELDRLEQSADVRLYIELKTRLGMMESASGSGIREVERMRTGFAAPGPGEASGSGAGLRPGSGVTQNAMRSGQLSNGMGGSMVASTSTSTMVDTTRRNDFDNTANGNGSRHQIQRDAEEYLAENG